MNRHSVTTLSGLVLTAAFTLATSTAPSIRPPTRQELSPDRPECPHEYGKIKAPDSTELVNGTIIPAPAMLYGTAFPSTSDIPEFNDCQRIILESGSRYGPLMSVFASDRLGQLRFSKADETDTYAVAAVQVLNYSRGFYYRPLGIGPLFNCLYLWGYSGNWHAKMVSRGVDNSCSPRIDLSSIAGGTTLAVIEAPAGAFTNRSDYPAAARWEWDRRNNIQYIGLRCGPGWCQVGRADAAGNPAFAPAGPYIAAPTDAARGADRVRSIKGWYDEQRLAIVKPTTGGGFVAEVSGVTGWVFPAPDLVRHTQFDHFKSFIPVAYVALETMLESDPAVKYYKDKFNYDVVPRGSALSRMTEIALCYGSWKSCAGWSLPDPALKASCGGPAAFAAVASKGDKRWWARLTSRVTSSVIFRCVTRRTHDPAPNDMPASARWRWLARDETTWDYCMSGCCETEGFHS